MGLPIDGKAVSDVVKEEVRLRVARFLEQHGRLPSLHVVLVGDDPASQVYVRNKELGAKKAGLAGEVHRLAADVSQAELLAKVAALNADPAIDGILVQLPLPKHLDEQSVIDSIDPGKDVDGLHPVNAGLLTVGREGLRPCTPSGCMRLLQHVGVDPAGKRAVVIGRKADIVVAAVGRPDMVKGSWLKPGAVVIDVGINRKPDGKLTGDVDFADCLPVAAHVTPVPC